MTKPDEPRPYQFTIRALLLLPLVVVATAAIGHWFGSARGVMVVVLYAFGLFWWVYRGLNRDTIQLLVRLGILGSFPNENLPVTYPPADHKLEPDPFNLAAPLLFLLLLGVVVAAAVGHWFGPVWNLLVVLAYVIGLGSWVCLVLKNSLIRILVVFVVLGVIVAQLLPSTSHPEASRRSWCRNRLQQIGIALRNYESVHGCFPPTVVTDDAGRPLHSWRTLILPYMEQKPLYDAIDLSLPWDAPENQWIAERNREFACPARPTDSGRPAETSYVAIIAPNTAWPPDGCRAIKDLADGTTRTILVVEVANSGIDWMEPRDLTLEELSMTINDTPDKSVSSHHPDGVHVLFADGSVAFLPNDLAEETLRALLTVDFGLGTVREITVPTVGSGWLGLRCELSSNEPPVCYRREPFGDFAGGSVARKLAPQPQPPDWDSYFSNGPYHAHELTRACHQPVGRNFR